MAIPGIASDGSENPTRAKNTVLVTGGAGFIGSHLVARLLEMGHSVTVMDDLSTGTIENIDLDHPCLTFIEGNICNLADCRKAIGPEIEAVFHLAAMSKVAPSLGGPEASDFCHESNVNGTRNVLRAAYDAGRGIKVIYAASSTCYGNSPVPQSESQLPDLITPYAVSKYQGELLVQMYARVYSLPTCSLRFFMVYGPRQPLSGAYATVNGIFLRQALSGKSLTIQGSGLQTRDFIHVKDVVEGLVTAWQCKTACQGQSFNLGTGKQVSIKDVAAAVAEEVSAATGKPEVGIQQLPPRAFDLHATQACTELASSVLAWNAQIDFREGIKSWIRYEMERGSLLPSLQAKDAANASAA